MDIPQLAADTVKFIAPYLPYLIAGTKLAAKAAIEKTGENFSDAVWKKAEELWGKLKPKTDASPSAQSAVEKAARKPEDPRVLGNLEVELEEIFEQDEVFAQSIQAGNYSLVVGGNIENSNVLNNSSSNRIIQANTYIEGNVYNGPAPRNPQEALKIYRDVLASMTSSLSMRGIDLRASDPSTQKEIGLANVYIDLDTTISLNDTLSVKEVYAKIRNGEKLKTLSALQAIVQNRYLVIKGDPGSGKSTFVNYITYCLATLSTDRLEGWKQEDAELLPMIVILRDFVRGHKKLPSQAEPRHIWDFIEKRLKDQKLSASSKPIQEILENGKAVIFLDGLDEVSTSAQRIFVRDAVNAFVKRYPKNRYMVTCRILSYQPPASKNEQDLRLTSFPEFELAPFDDEKIESFIESWYNESIRVGIVTPELANDLRTGLKTAVQRVELRKLAANPLLLTVMAVVNTNKGRLPDARALLYKDAVEILLWQWEQSNKGQEAHLRQLLLEANCADTDLEQVIWELAYEAHAQTDKNDEDEEALAGISESKLQKSLAAINKGSLDWAVKVIEAMKLRAGLLLERDNNIFTFPHRSFQEFLAGTYLESKDDFVSRAKELAKDQQLWRQVILWAVSRRVYIRGSNDGPLALVAELCPSRSPMDEQGWRTIWLAGDILLEVGLNRVERSELGKELLPRLQNRLVELLEGSHLTPRERAEAGNTLAKLGDPRFDEEHWHLPKESLVGFVHIPAGDFLMGTKKSDIKSLVEKFGSKEDLYENETEQHKVNLPDYFMARYPVTVAQFKAFVEESGHKPQDEYSLRGILTHSVVYVTWFDAIAYCNWLNEKLIAIAPNQTSKKDESRGKFWRGIESGKLIVSLPSEAEWEKSARGMDGRGFPWGEDINLDKVNANKVIGRTSSVGSFPQGKSPYDLQDMSGNVWEWTRSIYKPYEYNPKDGRENLEDQKDVRVLRGGAFHNEGGDVRCACRGWNHPSGRSHYIGFRVVVCAGVSHFS